MEAPAGETRPTLREKSAASGLSIAPLVPRSAWLPCLLARGWADCRLGRPFTPQAAPSNSKTVSTYCTCALITLQSNLYYHAADFTTCCLDCPATLRSSLTSLTSHTYNTMLASQPLRQLRRYSTRVPRDPHFKLKATLMTGYLVSAFTLPFVPPLLETRRTRADGSYLTRLVVQFDYCNAAHTQPGKTSTARRHTLDAQDESSLLLHNCLRHIHSRIFIPLWRKPAFPFYPPALGCTIGHNMALLASERFTFCIA